MGTLVIPVDTEGVLEKSSDYIGDLYTIKV